MRFSTIEMIHSHIQRNPTCNGFILYNQSSAQTQFPRVRLLSTRYTYLRKLIGNTPNLYQRYLETVQEGTDRELLRLFPAFRYYSSYVDKCLDRIIHDSYNLYIEKHMKKNFEMMVNYYYNPILRDLHKLFISRQADETVPKENKKIVLQDVQKLMWGYHPRRVIFILMGLGFLKKEIIETVQKISESEFEEKQ
jgi:hypothetical protein